MRQTFGLLILAFLTFHFFQKWGREIFLFFVIGLVSLAIILLVRMIYQHGREGRSRNATEPPVHFTIHSSHVVSATIDPPLRVALSYLDRDQKKTVRIVRIEDFEVMDGGYIMFSGYCELRKNTRNFRSDRVLESYDPETGEVFDLKDRIFSLMAEKIS